jgi:DNA-binding MarR family transcriptional regulator
VRGHGTTPTVGDIAGHLLLRHHSAVELIDRAEWCDLVHRHRDRDDARLVRVALTTKGRRLLDQLSPAHLVELKRMRGPVGDLPPAETTG